MTGGRAEGICCGRADPDDRRGDACVVRDAGR